MLKISVEERGNSLRLILEGKLMGPWVNEFERLCGEWSQLRPSASTTIDLCGLTAMDGRGRAALEKSFHQGAILQCSDVMNQYLRRTDGSTSASGPGGLPAVPIKGPYYRLNHGG